MDSTITHILILSLVLVFSPHLSKIFKLPTAPIEIVIGAVLGYFGLIASGDDIGVHYFNLLSEIGFLYLMFLAGLEINLKSITNMPKEYIIRSNIFLAILIFFTIIIGNFVLRLNFIITSALPLISVGILATLSKEHGKDTNWVAMSFLIGAIGEVLSITALTILEVAVAVGFTQELFAKVILLILFLISILVIYYLLRLIFWWYPELKNIMMPNIDEKDKDFRLAIGLFFIMIAIMKILHLELAFGAFIAGLFISTFFHHKKQLEEKITSFGFGFLVPIFFIHVGTSFDFDFFFTSIAMALKILIVMLLIRVIASFSLFNLFGYKNAILVALSLSMPLTLLVATATIGFTNGILSEADYNALILSSLLEVIFSIIFIKLLIKKRDR